MMTQTQTRRQETAQSAKFLPFRDLLL